MAKQVVWSTNSENDINSILSYRIERNGNDIFSKKLFKEFHHIVDIISQFPDSGRKTRMVKRDL